MADSNVFARSGKPAVGRRFDFLTFIPMKALPVIDFNHITDFVDESLGEIRQTDDPQTIVKLPRLKRQEIPYDAEASVCRFVPSEAKPFLDTNGAETRYGRHVIRACQVILQRLAKEHDGLDYLQIFEDQTGLKSEPLCFIEDGDGGAITALLPSDY